MTSPPGSFHVAFVLVMIGIYGAAAARSPFRKLLSVLVSLSGALLALVSLARSLRPWRPPDLAGLHGLALLVLGIAVLHALVGAALVVGGRRAPETHRPGSPRMEDDA